MMMMMNYSALPATGWVNVEPAIFRLRVRISTTRPSLHALVKCRMHLGMPLQYSRPTLLREQFVSYWIYFECVFFRAFSLVRSVCLGLFLCVTSNLLFSLRYSASCGLLRGIKEWVQSVSWSDIVNEMKPYSVRHTVCMSWVCSLYFPSFIWTCSVSGSLWFRSITLRFPCFVSSLFWFGCQYQFKWSTGKTRLRCDLHPTNWLTHSPVPVTSHFGHRSDLHNVRAAHPTVAD